MTADKYTTMIANVALYERLAPLKLALDKAMVERNTAEVAALCKAISVYCDAVNACLASMAA